MHIDLVDWNLFLIATMLQSILFTSLIQLLVFLKINPSLQYTSLEIITIGKENKSNNAPSGDNKTN